METSRNAMVMQHRHQEHKQLQSSTRATHTRRALVVGSAGAACAMSTAARSTAATPTPAGRSEVESTEEVERAPTDTRC